MPLANTGDLNEIIQIITPSSTTGETDDYGDPVVSKPTVVYPRLFAFQRSLAANEVAGNLEVLRNQTQFVIRHRLSKEPLITTDMELIHKVDNDHDVKYKILDYNEDSAHKEWDVIICERAGQKE